MTLTLYRRSFAVADSPVALLFAPDPVGQRHTFSRDGRVYESKCRELHVTVPDSAKIDTLKNVLCWSGSSGLVRSTAKEVFDLATAGDRGFSLVKG